MALRIAATRPDPALLTLPWHQSLEEWDDEHLVPLPRGLSRHVVRFVRLGEHVYAVKETREPIALGEYRLLRDLRRLKLPAVEPVGVVTGRLSSAREPIEPRAGHPAPVLLPALPPAVSRTGCARTRWSACWTPWWCC
jgi:hypothetical protein